MAGEIGLRRADPLEGLLKPDASMCLFRKF